MYTISECVACVVLIFTLSTFLSAFCVVLLTIRWESESRRRASREIRQDTTRVFSHDQPFWMRGTGPLSAEGRHCPVYIPSTERSLPVGERRPSLR